MKDKIKVLYFAIIKRKRFNTLYKHFLWCKNEFGIGLEMYFNKELYIERHDEWVNIIAKKVSEMKNITIDRATFKIYQISELFGIAPMDYYRNAYYEYTNYHLADGIICMPTEKEYIDKMAEVIKLRTGISKKQAKERIEYIKNRFHVTYKTIMFQCFYKCTDSQIREKLERITGSWEGSISSGLRYIANREKVSLEMAEQRIKELKDKFGIDAFFNRKYFKMDNETIFQLLDKNDERRMNEIIAMAEKTGKPLKAFLYDRNINMLAFGISKETFNGLKLALRPLENINSFIIDSDMRYLMTKYNMSDDKEVLDNKFKFLKFFSKLTNRAFWSNVNEPGYEAFMEFLNRVNSEQIIVKPLKGLAGKNIKKYDLEARDAEEIYKEINKQGDIIAEECVVNHDDLSFGSGALNSMRILSIYENQRCNIIYAFFRVGIRNNIVDNLSQGGYISRINLETGMLESNGITMNEQIYINDPVSMKKIKGTQIPYWQEALDMIDKASSMIKNVGFVGWDVAISPYGPILIEGNSNPLVSANEYLYLEKEFGHRDILEKYLDEVHF